MAESTEVVVQCVMTQEQIDALDLEKLRQELLNQGIQINTIEMGES